MHSIDQSNFIKIQIPNISNTNLQVCSKARIASSSRAWQSMTKDGVVASPTANRKWNLCSNPTAVASVHMREGRAAE